MINLNVIVLLWLCAAMSCGGGADRATQAAPNDRYAALGQHCKNTQACQGGLFCDRGECLPVYTPWFGHGYGAQCVDDSAYADPNGSRVHCRNWPCGDGHCSSCSMDQDCPGGARCVSEHDLPGKRCQGGLVNDATLEPSCGSAKTPPCVPPQVNELDSPAKIVPKDSACRAAADCGGDQFCDRGRCAWLGVNQYGQGYGAVCQRTEPPSLQDMCSGYPCIDAHCSSCLDDSECFASAPHCIVNPFSPHGRVCDTHEQSYYFDDQGELKTERQVEYESFKKVFDALQALREQAGLHQDAASDSPQLSQAQGR